MKHPLITLTFEADIAFINLDIKAERVNTLSTPIVARMEEILDEIEAKKAQVTGVVVCSEKDDFIVGFDIKELKSYNEDPGGLRDVVERGHRLMERFDKLDIPFVAAIHGNCLGGGLEVALACHGRVASNSKRTKLGLPEIQLGLYPGGGGTQRLPRLIDLQVALDMILTAKNLNARKAKKVGLVDDVVHPGIVKQVAADLARKLAKNPKKNGGFEISEVFSDPGGQAMKIVAASPARAIVFNKAREMVLKKTGGHYPAATKALDVMEVGLAKGLKAGLKAEADGFVELVQTDVAKNLMGIFFMKQEVDKDPVVSSRTKPIPVTQVGVLGAGLMGAGITQLLAFNETNVRLKDRDAKGLGWGINYCHDLFDKLVSRKKMRVAEADIAMGRIAGTTTYDGFSNCEIVIEAVFEDLQLKRKILKDLEAVAHDDMIFASNTSTIPIAEIAAEAKNPQNVLGMHFFSPVHKMPLLEIIKTKHTSAKAIATALKVGREMGKTCIVVNDGPGFFTSRVIGAYVNEAGWVLQEGGKIDDIDRAMKAWGFPVGPLKLVDEVGIDVAMKAAGVLKTAFEGRWDQPESLRAIADDGRKGRKNGKGLYTYGEQRSVVDESVYKLIGGGARKEIPRQIIQDRIWLSMLNECAYCLQEKIAEKPRDIDIGVIFGLGFPPFRGGILHHADHVGIQNVVDTMNTLAEQYGERLRPAKILVDMADKNQIFFE